jgi:hypothetical protein
MENDEPKSANELKLRQWLTDNDVYPGNEAMQSLVLNSFYSEFEEEEPNDDDLIPFDEVDLDTLGISDGFDYRAYQKSDEEEEQEWKQKISYALNNPERFLAYINEHWRNLE